MCLDRKIPVKNCIEVVRFQEEELRDDGDGVSGQIRSNKKHMCCEDANQQEILCSDGSSLALFY